MPFNGLAVYDHFNAVGEDVSDLVAFLAPYETPLLDIIGAGDRPATNVKHEWLGYPILRGPCSERTVRAAVGRR